MALGRQVLDGVIQQGHVLLRSQFAIRRWLIRGQIEVVQRALIDDPARLLRPAEVVRQVDGNPEEQGWGANRCVASLRTASCECRPLARHLLRPLRFEGAYAGSGSMNRGSGVPSKEQIAVPREHRCQKPSHALSHRPNSRSSAAPFCRNDLAGCSTDFFASHSPVGRMPASTMRAKSNRKVPGFAPTERNRKRRCNVAPST